jgi:hypothetical protein
VAVASTAAAAVAVATVAAAMAVAAVTTANHGAKGFGVGAPPAPEFRRGWAMP